MIKFDRLSGIGLHEKTKEDKGEFFHIDKFIDNGGKDRKNMEMGDLCKMWILLNWYEWRWVLDSI